MERAGLLYHLNLFVSPNKERNLEGFRTKVSKNRKGKKSAMNFFTGSSALGRDKRPKVKKDKNE